MKNLFAALVAAQLMVLAAAAETPNCTQPGDRVRFQADANLQAYRFMEPDGTSTRVQPIGHLVFESGKKRVVLEERRYAERLALEIVRQTRYPNAVIYGTREGVGLISLSQSDDCAQGLITIDAVTSTILSTMN